MEKIALITDTTCDLSDETVKKYNIHELPFRIIYKEKEYRDKYEITSKRVYENLKKEVPTSSMPGLGDMEELFNKLENEGYTHAIVVTLSTGLSGVYNGIKMVSENHPKIKTHLYDSKSISLGEGIIVVECAKLIEKNKSFDEIVKELPKIKSRISLYFVVGTLEYLIKGGRIGKVAGTIAKVMNIKPIISPDSNGIYTTCAKARGRKQSLNKIVEIIENHLSTHKSDIYIMHGDGEEDAKKVYDKIKDLHNVGSITLEGYISPVSGVHTGPGLVGVVCFDRN